MSVTHTCGVLNAFRHLVCNHLSDQTEVAVFYGPCSTPFGIWYVITLRFGVPRLATI